MSDQPFEMDDERNGTHPEPTCTRPGRKRRAASGDRPADVFLDIGLGVSCGLAALGIAAVTWIGAASGHAVAECALEAPQGTSWRSGESSNATTITVNVTASGRLCSVIGAAATRVTMPEGSTVAALSSHLADLYPVLAPTAMLAVDDSSGMMPLDQVLTDGQSVELIGSMAGG